MHDTLLRRGAFRYQDDAPWNNNIIENVIERNEWDLHVISSHFGMQKKMETFEDRGVTYHFFKGEMVFPQNKIDKWLHPSEYSTYNRNRKYVKEILDDINPEIVLLVGAENPRYSITALDVFSIPLFILCQTVVDGNDVCAKLTNKNTLKIEKELFEKTPYVAVYCRKHYNQLVSSGYKGNIFEFQWPPSTSPANSKIVYIGPKEYDFINFATRATEDKGFTDTVRALSIVKKKYNDVKLNLKVDPGKEKDDLIKLIDSLNLHDNISFTGSFEYREDLFRHIQKSRFAVLPCKLDNTSGTMSQCMRYNIPIVVYKTMGTQAFNEEKECAMVAEMGNIQDLAQKMLYLMDNPQKAEEIKKNAADYILNRKEKRKNAMDRLVADIDSIIDNYHYGTPIPSELLFNPEINY